MITSRHNCDDGYISLVDIELHQLPETISVDEYQLLKKDEFHVSLVCLKQLDEMLAPDVLGDKKEAVKNSFLEFERSNPLVDFKLTGEYRLVKRKERVTIVAMVSMPGLEELFTKLRADTGLNLPTQPAHITIYTLQPNVGIGLTSLQQIEAESVGVGLPELSEINVG